MARRMSALIAFSFSLYLIVLSSFRAARSLKLLSASYDLRINLMTQYVTTYVELVDVFNWINWIITMSHNRIS